MTSPRCDVHRRNPVFPAACPTCSRISVEQDIITRACAALLNAGFALAIDDQDGGETRPATPTTDLNAIRAELMATDDDIVLCFRGTERVRWVRFIYGNDGWDVIADYLTSLDPVLEPVIDYADELGGAR